jgi:hypothetical protein
VLAAMVDMQDLEILAVLVEIHICLDLIFLLVAHKEILLQLMVAVVVETHIQQQQMAVVQYLDLLAVVVVVVHLVDLLDMMVAQEAFPIHMQVVAVLLVEQMLEMELTEQLAQ